MSVKQRKTSITATKEKLSITYTVLVPVPTSWLYFYSVFQLFDKILIANRGEIACRVSKKQSTVIIHEIHIA